MKRLYLFIFSVLLGSVFAQGPALTIGNVDYDANTIEIYYDFQQDFAGFQFNIDGVTLTDNAYGGLIDEYGVLNIYVDPADGLVFGFSWEPITIPGGSGLLGILTFSDLAYTDICLTNGSFSSPEGQTLVSGLEDCVDCAGDEYGDAVWDDCNVCSGGSSGHEADSDKDCAGDCFGEAFTDDCGVCSGGNSGHLENSDQDCEGTCFGDAFWPECFGCTDHQALNYNPDAILLDDSCEYPPAMFLFSQSSQQNAYFIQLATLNGVELAPEDWIGGFKGDVCVGATQWSGPYTDLVLMGFDDDAWTQGYMLPGDIPTFMIYDASEDVYRDAFAEGVDPGLEWYATTFVDIDLLHAEQDCFGEWNGAAHEDMCGVCDYDYENDCVQDCAGVWGGDAVVDECGVCNGPGAIYECGCEDIPDGACDCEGNVVDECGVCGGPGAIYECGCEDIPEGACDCEGNVVDECGVCGGPGAVYECGCEDIPEGDCDCEGNVSDCNGDCNGSAYLDDCGVCSGGNSGHAENSDQDCEGTCFGDVFWDECFGCTDDGAINWSPNAIIDDGSCVYPPDGFWFAQSSSQAVYFVELATSIDNITLEDGDWLAGFKNGLCVGSAPWSGPFTDLILMGEVNPDEPSGEPWTAGYMLPGDVPDFMIYDASEDAFLPAFASGVAPGLEWYDQQFVNIDLLSVFQDCNGVWGGTAFIDMCGDCVGGDTGLTYCVQDCAGTWGGTAYADICGTCDADPANDGASCTGCMDPMAANYDDGALVDCMDCCQYFYDIDLHSGANLISFNGLPADNSIENVLAPLLGNAYGAIAEGTAAQPHPLDPTDWIGSLEFFNLTSGYWLKVWDDATLTVNPEVWADNPTYALHDGPNLISYPYDSPYLVTDALPTEVLAHLTGIIGEGEATMPHPTMPDVWIGNLTHFMPHKGYWFKMDSDLSMNYNPLLLTRDANAVASVKNVPAEYSYVQSSHQAFYFIENVLVDGESMSENDLLIAYNDGVEVGAGYWTGEYTEVPVMGAGTDADLAGYCRSGDAPGFKVYLANTGELVDLYTQDIPAWSDNGMFTLGTMTNEPLDTPAAVNLLAAYPNPFNPTTTISFVLPEQLNVRVVVMDMTGRVVTELVDGVRAAGYNSVTWDAGNESSGVYFVRMTGEGFAQTQKVMLIK